VGTRELKYLKKYMKENFDNSEKRDSVRNYYEILGVSSTATPEEIKAALRKRAHELHPDKPENRMKEEEFKDVNAAYQVLSNPEKRRHYDLTIQHSRPVVTASSKETVKQPNKPSQTNDFNYDDWFRRSEEATRKIMDDMDKRNREFQKSMDEAKIRNQKLIENLRRQSEENMRRMMDSINERNRKFKEMVDEKMKKRARKD
jgi:DnaJ-class molecular chaperone